MNENNKFSTKLVSILEHYNLTASAFADVLGVQKSSISHLLSDRNNPGIEFIIKVVENFKEVDLNWLLLNKGAFPKIEDSTPKNIISTSNSANNEVEKIIVFYKNGEFKSYNPKEI